MSPNIFNWRPAYAILKSYENWECARRPVYKRNNLCLTFPWQNANDYLLLSKKGDGNVFKCCDFMAGEQLWIYNLNETLLD